MARSAAVAAVAASLILAGVFPVRAQSPEERLVPCLACHGEKGQSKTPEVPSLGGQPELYLTIQLVMFRERLRQVEPMNAMMQGASDNDVRTMAAFVAKLPPPQSMAGPTDAARMEAARTLAQSHRCNFCHAGNYAGQENVPRLAGQREDYLVKTLRAYKSNTRRGYDASMADVIQPITDEQILDLAYFLARVR